jgi:hypothetical protein
VCLVLAHSGIAEWGNVWAQQELLPTRWAGRLAESGARAEGSETRHLVSYDFKRRAATGNDAYRRLNFFCCAFENPPLGPLPPSAFAPASAKATAGKMAAADKAGGGENIGHLPGVGSLGIESTPG